MLSNTAVPQEYGAFRDAVRNGETRVNREVSMQMNLIDDLIDDPRYFYDSEAIQGYINFCENEMVLPDGSDLTLLPTFKLWAEDLLAWYYYIDEEWFNPRTGEFEVIKRKMRLRNRQFLIIARSNSKSYYASTIQFYGLVVDTDTTQQTHTAPTMKQGREVTGPIKTCLARAKGPVLKFLTQGNNKSRSGKSQAKLTSTKEGIENKITNSILEIKPMSVDTLQGLKNKYATLDEWLSTDIREDVIGTLEQGAAKQDDYIVLAVSSEGTVRDSIGDSIKMELLSILRGDVCDPHTSIWYYKLDDISEVKDPTAWVKASPNIGATVKYETYRREVERMKYNPSRRNDILAKRFGIPVSGHTYFFTYDEVQRHAMFNVDGEICAMGMDASQGDDFWAFTWVFPSGGRMYGVKSRAYIAQSKYNKQTSATKLKYDRLIAEGTLVVMDGNILDWMEVFEDVVEYIAQHDWAVLAFGFDPYNAGPFVEKWSTDFGDIGVEVVRQGVRTESVPLGEIKTMTLNRELVFDEELMEFAFGNAIVEEDNNGGRKLYKKRNDEKIDNVSALMDAWVAYTRNKEAFE